MHLSYIIGENDDYYIYISLTHAKNTRSIRNIALKGSVKTGDTKRNYLVPMICVDEKRYFSTKKMNYKFKKADGPTLRKFYQNYKKSRENPAILKYL